jgi:uncharacterized protein with ATP-grasp and redox domains
VNGKEALRHQPLFRSVNLDTSVNRSTTPSDLPAPLAATEPDSFVHHTVTVRWPRIAQRVIEENNYAPEINGRIQSLIDDLPKAPIRALEDPEAPDESLWNQWIEPYQGQSWLECPWFFGETYFYRRIIEAIRYFQRGPSRDWDPFTVQKELGYSESIDGIRALAQARAEALDGEQGPTELVGLLKTALWGNQADLSMWDADADGPDHLGTGRGEEHLLVDDTGTVIEHLNALDRPVRVDVWGDNAGFELVTDLALIDGLLSRDIDRVVLHVKAHPTFVSDTTVDDVRHALDLLGKDDDEATRALSTRLKTALADGRLLLSDALTWTSPLRAREFPANVNAELARADLLISKGDANYRRLLGDRHWSFTTPFKEVMSYFPAPLLTLRTLKAEVAAGLSSEQVDRLNETDPDWAVNGRWGLIQFAPV